MNGTPRLRSAYPSTPGSSRKNGLGSTSPRPASEASTPSKPAQANQNKDGDGPLVPLSILDAPTQRLSVSLFYFCLMLWRFYNYYKLVSDETESLWLFMKWVAIDGVFLFGLPELRIPWMEWSSTLMTFLFLFHAVLNAFLMFRIPVDMRHLIGNITTITNWLLGSIGSMVDIPYENSV
jgi:nucleoporin POM152